MKVSYVTMAFPAPAETFAGSDVRALLRAGVRVAVHSLRPADPNASRMIAERQLEPVTMTHNSATATARGLAEMVRRPMLAVRTLGWLIRRALHQPGELARSIVLLPRCFGILAAIEREQPDVVHLFWGHYPSLVGRLVREALPRTPLTMFLGAYDLTMQYGPTRPIACGADVVWTHARENVAAIERLGVRPETIRVVYRGTEFAGIPATRAKTPYRVVVASRLIAAKAVDDALEVFARVHASCGAASLVVLGDGPERENLVALAGILGIADRVSFRGHVPHHVVRQEMADAEVLILMSKKDSERLPNVAKEAMASGCVCVVTRTPGIDELVEDGVTGVVVEPGAIADAAGGIDELFTDPDRAREMASRAERHVRLHFDVDRSMATYREVWQGLIVRADAPHAASRESLTITARTTVQAGRSGEVECA